MSDGLRPLSLGEILDRTVSLYRSRFLVFAGISIVPMAAVLAMGCGAILLAVGGIIRGGGAKAEALGPAVILFIGGCVVIGLPLFLAAYSLSIAATQHAANRIFAGETITIRGAYRAIWPRGWRYIWLYVLLALIVVGIPIAACSGLIGLAGGVGAVTGGGATAGVLVGFAAFAGVAASMVYVILVLLRFSLAFPVCVVEGISAWAAVKRGGKLSEGTRGRIFLLYLLGMVLNYALSIGMMFIVLIVIALIPGSMKPEHVQTTTVVMTFVNYAGSFAMQTLIGPIYGIALLLFYYDQRIRKEGYDIEWMMQRAGLVGAGAAPMMPAEVAEMVVAGQAAEPASPALAWSAEPQAEIAHE